MDCRHHEPNHGRSLRSWRELHRTLCGHQWRRDRQVHRLRRDLDRRQHGPQQRSHHRTRHRLLEPGDGLRFHVVRRLQDHQRRVYLGPDRTLQGPGGHRSRDARTLYAGTAYGGVFKSTDSGGTWVASALGAQDVRALAIDPATPATLYAGTDYGGVFNSIDSGDTWTTANANLRYVWSLAIDAVTPAIIYAGTRQAGVLRSIDSGATWTAVNAGLTDLRISTLVTIPVRRARSTWQRTPAVYLGSTDSGGTWTQSTPG